MRRTTQEQHPDVTGLRIADDDRSPYRAARLHEPRAEQVSRENRAASRTGELDARFILAEHVVRELEGGHAAILRPERRRALVATALDLGLRRFDAYLVIAIVQESARRGDVLSLASLSGDGACATSRESRRVRARISVLPTAREHRGERVELLILTSVMLGLVILAALVTMLGP